MCRRRGAIAASVPLAGLRIVKGEGALRLYQFNTRTARHYFCSNCGIYTHHQRRSNPEEYGYNVACLEGVNPFDLAETAEAIREGLEMPEDERARRARGLTRTVQAHTPANWLADQLEAVDQVRPPRRRRA